MMTSRKETERQARKKLIIDGALKVFKTKGLEHATMDEIAHEADFGKATLYYYFKSKEEIFNTILITGWITLWDGIEDIVIEEGTPRRQFIKIIKKLIELVNEDRPLYEFLFAAPHSSSTQDQLEPEWNAALKLSPHSGPFLTYEWLLSYLEAFGDESQLFLVVVRRDTKIVGLAPLNITQDRQLVFIGYPLGYN